MTIPSRAARRRAARPVVRLAEVDPREGASKPSGASTGILDGVTSETGSRRWIDQAERLADLRALPIVAHPLRLYLVARGVSHEQAARLLGVTPRTLHAWLAWRSRPDLGRANEIATALGLPVGELFPASPDAKRSPA